MLTDAFVIGAGLLWLGLLFGTALWAERRPGLLARQWPVVYSLSLAVYCTSWTFYGTVTQAQRSGWAIPPTFLGTILLYLLGSYGSVAEVAHAAAQAGIEVIALPVLPSEEELRAEFEGLGEHV